MQISTLSRPFLIQRLNCIEYKMRSEPRNIENLQFNKRRCKKKFFSDMFGNLGPSPSRTIADI